MFMICIESGFNSYARTLVAPSDNNTLVTNIYRDLNVIQIKG